MHPEILAAKTASCFQRLKSESFLKSFYLGGGTAVALLLGHRQSVDLDFFSSSRINTLQLQQNLSSCGNFILDQESPGTLHGSLDQVKFSFLEYSYSLLQPPLIYEGIAVANRQDLCCMKLEAIASRGKKRDFFDVYALAQEGHSLNEMLLWFQKKYQSIHYNQLHLIKSLVYFDDAEPDPDPLLLKPMKWSEVKRFFRHETPKLVSK